MIPTIGRVVLVKIKEASETNEAVWRPAIITAVWTPTCINVRVFYDGSNDNTLIPYGEWLTSVSEGEGVRNWRWPPRD